MKRKFTVYMEVPEGANMHDAAAYIHDAVASMGGALRYPGAYDKNDPGDPMFGHHNCHVAYRFEGEHWTTEDGE